MAYEARILEEYEKTIVHHEHYNTKCFIIYRKMQVLKLKT